jgi:hypothetical protein
VVLEAEVEAVLVMGELLHLVLIIIHILLQVVLVDRGLVTGLEVRVEMVLGLVMTVLTAEAEAAMEVILSSPTKLHPVRSSASRQCLAEST